MAVKLLDDVDFSQGIKNGWTLSDSTNELAVDGYNIFFQIDTSDGSSGFEILNSNMQTTFLSNSYGDGYIAGSLGIGTLTPQAQLDVIGKTRTSNFQVTTTPTFGYSLIANDAYGNAVWGNPLNIATRNNLLLNVAVNSYDQIIYSGLNVTNYIVWTSSAMTQKIREEAYTYSGLQVVTAVYKQYDNTGALAQTITENYTYTGFNVTSITRTSS